MTAWKYTDNNKIISNTDEENNKSLLDDSQPNIYREVQIGKQVWMAENLNVENFLNGEPIPYIESDEEWLNAFLTYKPGWCYYNNDPANGDKYGKLYNYHALSDPRGLAPKGWRIPYEKDWLELANYLGGLAVAGDKLKSIEGWKNDKNGTNETGFTALPCGYRYGFGLFEQMGASISFWSATYRDEMYIWNPGISYNSSELYMNVSTAGHGFSVRCIKK